MTTLKVEAKQHLYMQRKPVEIGFDRLALYVGGCLLVDLAGVRLLWNMLGFNWACDECAVNCHFEEATQGFRFL